MSHKINRAFFFATIKKNVKGFKGGLTQSQVDGMNYKLDIWESKYADKDDRWLAYGFATNCIETGYKMIPVQEIGGNSYFIRKYWDNLKVRKQLGNLSQQDAINFSGKGDVQCTGRRNYSVVSKLIKVDLVSNPQKMLEPSISAWSMFEGMINGIYTTKKLSDFFSPKIENWTGARAIINGKDRAKEIGDIGKEFYKAISYMAS